MDIIHPPDWARLPGYSHGVSARGRTIYLAGQVGAPGAQGWQPENDDLVPADFVEQFRQVLENIVALLAEADAKPEHLVKLTWFITDKAVYFASLKAVGQAYREVIGRHYPAMSVIEVRGLVQPGAMVEIEATAVVPD
jgi:enamine deaminase RidA (YjgF/YER057c/UK114 family)